MQMDKMNKIDRLYRYDRITSILDPQTKGTFKLPSLSHISAESSLKGDEKYFTFE